MNDPAITVLDLLEKKKDLERALLKAIAHQLDAFTAETGVQVADVSVVMTTLGTLGGGKHSACVAVETRLDL